MKKQRQTTNRSWDDCRSTKCSKKKTKEATSSAPGSFDVLTSGIARCVKHRSFIRLCLKQLSTSDRLREYFFLITEQLNPINVTLLTLNFWTMRSINRMWHHPKHLSWKILSDAAISGVMSNNRRLLLPSSLKTCHVHCTCNAMN